MSVKGKNFKIKNAQINPNITSDGLIFHIDPVYSTKSDTNYLYDSFYNFSNLISDGSTPYVISGTYTQTTNTLSSFSTSVTYSFGVGSFNNASGFLTSGDQRLNNSVYSIFEFGGTATPGTNLKLTMFGLVGSTFKNIAVFGSGGYTFSSTQSGSTLLTTLVNNFVELPTGFTAGVNSQLVESNGIFTTDSKFLSFITSIYDGWKYEGNISFLTSNSLGSGGFTFSWVNSFTWSTSGIIGSYSSTKSPPIGVPTWKKSSGDNYTSLPKMYDDNLAYHFDNNNYDMYNYQDKAVFPLVNKGDNISALWYPNVSTYIDDIEHQLSDEPLYHDDNLNLLFIQGSTRTVVSTYSYYKYGAEDPLLLVYDTNLNKLCGTISFGLTGSPGLGFTSTELISIDDDLYCYIPTYSGCNLYYINKTNLTANLIFEEPPYLSYTWRTSMKSFKWNNKKYILSSIPTIGGNYETFQSSSLVIYTVSPTTASVYTFSVPQSYNSWSLTYSNFERIPTTSGDSSMFEYGSISDVDTWGSTWSRLYIPSLGYSASNSYPNNQRSFVFVYGLTESSGNISVVPTPLNVLEFPNTVINRIYKIPDLQEKFWSVLLPAANRDRLYLFGSVIESGSWIIGTYSSGAANIQFGVSQSQFSSSSFKSGVLYNLSFYSGTQGSADRATYSSYWTWDNDPPIGPTISNPGSTQFTSMVPTFDGNTYFKIHRTTITDYSSSEIISTDTFTPFTQLTSDFNNGKPISMKISTYPNNYWIVRKNTPQDDFGASFISPYTDYVLDTSPKTGYDAIGWKCLGRLNNFFYRNWNNYIRTISTGTNIDRYNKYTEPSGRTFFGRATQSQDTSIINQSPINNFYDFFYQNRVCYNSTKNCYYTIRTSGSTDLVYPFGVTDSITGATYGPVYSDPDYRVLESNGDLNISASSGSLANFSIKTGYISLPNFGWQGFSNSGLRNKKVIDRITPVWDEGTISIWFHPRDIIGTASTFQSLFSCWEPIKKNQGTIPTTGRTFTQLSDNIEFFFGLGNFNGNGSTLTVKTRNKITYYKPVIDNKFNTDWKFNFTPKWFNITVSRSSTGLKVYLNGERLSTFSGDLETNHSTSNFINISGVNEKNSFFLNRRDSRVVVGGYRQFTLTQTSTATTSRYYHSGPIGLFDGFFSTVLIWRKELSDSEVKQNFNSLKSRFGL